MNIAALLLLATLNPTMDRADSIPGLVMRSVVIETERVQQRVLRGDYERPDAVVVVYVDLWPRLLNDVARHVLASDTELSVLYQLDTGRAQARAWVRGLERHTRAYASPGQIEFVEFGTDSIWVRDWGPLQLAELADRRALWLDADYIDEDREHDDEAALELARARGAKIAPLPHEIDGGAFISNGEGLCVLTFGYIAFEGYGEGELEDMLGQLGCSVTAIVPTMLREETKHADMIAQFVSPTRVLLAEIDPDLDLEDSLRLDEAELGLRRAGSVLGLDLEVVRVPTPPTIKNITRSYVNGLRLADRFLMPRYPRQPRSIEREAHAAIQGALDGVDVVLVSVAELENLGGAIHCAALGVFR
ncbi:agmatine deiminase family protein [Enhygromyxa salina]|uniref:Peptidylarginine deiminase n=1 Tax=Enhygromyxa salina TaxID=215803 RepID=A0A2S9YDA6_9BACT|nr:agmatine deiminase family protein [Enhygromyxa salina]PRQ03098.1 Peptidylarginine deiminase precursor [Enhygromyxa salina]